MMWLQPDPPVAQTGRHMMRRKTVLVFLALLLIPYVAISKGLGLGFWLEGTVSKVKVAGNQIHLVVTGRFWLEQFSDNHQRSIVTVDVSAGVPVVMRQSNPFFGMAANWGGGGIGQPGKLLAILRAAEEHHRVVRFELLEPSLVFSHENRLAHLTAEITRATDHDLH